MRGHHLKNMFDAVGFTYVLVFPKMIVLKYQDSTTDFFLKTLGETYFFWGWVGGGELSKQIGVWWVQI